jgi:hypothetical protein
MEAQSAKRTEDAVARLEQQLATTAGLIRCVCEGAVAAHVDAAASLWATDVDDASRMLTDTMGDEREPADDAREA